jgi:hypothetical protein
LQVKRVALIGAVALLTVGCSSAAHHAAARRDAPGCPASWRAGWQALANRIHAPVYCPTWLPSPLDGKIGGQWSDIDSVGRDRSYLISFLWQEQVSGEVHVNLRGYPGRMKVPTCSDLDTNKPVPCFNDSHGTRRIAGVPVTVYTANQGADLWHVLYAWHHGGSLYSISEHVAPPFSYGRVVQNLNRMFKGLVLIEPRA